MKAVHAVLSLQASLPTDAAYQQAMASINATSTLAGLYSADACAWLQQRGSPGGGVASSPILAPAAVLVVPPAPAPLVSADSTAYNSSDAPLD